MAYYIYHKPTHIQPRPLTDPHSELLTTLNEILQRYPLFSSYRYESHGLYYGPTYVAYLFLRLSEIFPSLSLGGKSCKEWCAEYLRIPPRKGITADRCGIGSELMAHMAVEACLKLDEGLVFAGVCSPDVTYIILDEEEAGSDEWLYGRAGYLYYLRMIRHFFPRNNARVHGVVENTIERTIQRIMKSPQPWRWHGNEYLGAVHGTIGIITQIILSNSDRLPALKPLLNRLLDQQLDNGNWPSSVGSHHPDRLVQLCHGAPGFVVSFISILPQVRGIDLLPARLQDSINLARENTIKERGFLVKEPCLCHGVTGNALALETPDMMNWLGHTTTAVVQEGLRMGMFTRGAEDGIDEKMGLWSGAAGRAWGFVVARMIPKEGAGWEGKLLGYNDL